VQQALLGLLVLLLPAVPAVQRARPGIRALLGPQGATAETALLAETERLALLRVTALVAVTG
jgi:hypothetical protein